MHRFVFSLAVAVLLALPNLHAQTELVQITPPPLRRAAPPAPNASAEELDARGDELRGQKAYLDALDYYRAALAKKRSASLYNKAGITELELRRDSESARDFERAVKLDRQFADAWNNLGVAWYLQQKYGKAVKEYEKAIKLKPDVASFYNNLGAAYYGKKDWEQASIAYGQALHLDPDIFERTSRTGVTAQLPSPEERARFEYLIAKLYAKQGDSDHALQYLRRALEEGYPGIDDVYKDADFEGLRKDTRFAQLMASRPPAIPE
ncbi:MAG: tetratricopeptide repeat protein [Terriglobales bacterium]|jgi:tetratricopeptide (TPR) repeat protein